MEQIEVPIHIDGTIESFDVDTCMDGVQHQITDEHGAVHRLKGANEEAQAMIEKLANLDVIAHVDGYRRSSAECKFVDAFAVSS